MTTPATMTRKEFQELVHEIAGRKLLGGWGSNAKWADLEELEVSWTSGGMTGGNCWGADASYAVESEPEPTFDDLDDLLLEVCPFMSFLYYKKLEQLMERDTRHESEYYGNYTVKAYKSLKIDDLWKFLLEYELVKESKAKGSK